FYTVASAEVAAALEHLGQLCPTIPPVSYRQSRDARGLARARLCYDHLAGQLGVALAEGMTAAGWVAEGLTEVTEAGAAHLESHGVDVTVLRGRRRPVIRPCADW